MYHTNCGPARRFEFCESGRLGLSLGNMKGFIVFVNLKFAELKIYSLAIESAVSQIKSPQAADIRKRFCLQI